MTQTIVAPSAKPLFTGGYTRWVLTLLLSVYTLNFIDRTIIATIGQAIKVDLKLTDAQLGLLGGFSFAVLYTILGLPLARLAERWNRVSIIALALVVWSGFTALCGVAASFTQLLLYRVGVGVGEAGCSPAAHSLISDYYPPRKRSSALAVYSFGIPLGAMIGAVAGGWLAQNLNWRLAFFVVGAPGAVVALIVKLVIKEPPRGLSEPASAGAPEAPPRLSLNGELGEVRAVGRALLGSWPVANIVIGVTLASFAGYGAGQFAPPYFIRTFALNYAQVGLLIGLIGGFSSGLGTLAGGFVTDWASRHGPRWYALVPCIGLAVSTPIYILAYSAPSWRLAGLILLVPGLFHYTYLGPTFGVVQNMVPTFRRATATAMLFFVLNFIALGFGPPFTGWIIDRFAAFLFQHPSSGLLTTVAGAIGDLVGPGASVPGFSAHCPGGAAVKGSAPALMAQCKGTLALATRDGMIVTFLFLTWAALHYLLGSFGLAKALAAARTARGESA
jgi:MFS family permease